jgi:hypothetical protein
MLVIGICIDKLEPIDISSPWLAATHVVAEPTLIPLCPSAPPQRMANWWRQSSALYPRQSLHNSVQNSQH